MNIIFHEDFEGDAEKNLRLCDQNKETVSGRRFLKDFGHAQNNKLRQFALFRGMELQLWQHNMAFFYDGKGKWEQLL